VKEIGVVRVFLAIQRNEKIVIQKVKSYKNFGTRKTEVLNSLIINITAKVYDNNITVIINMIINITVARCQLHRLLWP